MPSCISDERQLERLGRQDIVGCELHVDVMCAVALQVLKDLREVGRVAGDHTAHEDQPMPLRTLAELRAARPADAVEASLLDRLQFLVEGPLAAAGGMLHECPKISDVAQNWLHGRNSLLERVSSGRISWACF